MVATLEDLDEAALKKILTEPKNALVKQYQRLFEMENIELTFADEALGAVARKAIERKTGARGLRSILESILLDTMFDLPGLEGVEEVVISREVVEGNGAPALHLRRPFRPRGGEQRQRLMRCVDSSNSTAARLPRPSWPCSCASATLRLARFDGHFARLDTPAAR